MSPLRHQIKLEDRLSDYSSLHCTMNPSQISIPCSPLDAHRDGSLSYQKRSFTYPTYCEVPLAKSLRRHETSISTPPAFDLSYLSPLRSASPSSVPRPPSPPVSPSPPIASRPHIPRPPNAFMIYRSELIKNRTIPTNVEHRQQNISRLAGECWNLLPAEEKEKYHKKAAEVLLEHQRLNPNYKFTPAPRGSRRAKAKSQAEAVTEDSKRIRDIREQYVKLLGPSLVATRRRKRKAAKDRSPESDKSGYSSPHMEINPGLTFSGPSSPGSASSPMTVGSDDQPASYVYHPPFPQVSLPRRPSTSLGFNTPSAGLQEQTFHPSMTFFRPYNEALSTVLQGLDIAAPGVHDALPNTHFNLQPLPPFNFDGFTLSNPVHYNPFVGYDSSELLATPFRPPFTVGENGVQPQPFLLSSRGPCDVSPHDVGAGFPQGTSPVYDTWPLVNNPSDDLNYAVGNHIYNATLPPAPPSNVSQ